MNKTMFNGCAGCREPDWSKFSAFEIAGVQERDGDCLRVTPPLEADFYSVYGVLRAGGCQCITNVSTANIAREVARKYCGLSGIVEIRDYIRMTRL